jgi:hypothetical protein
MADCLLTELDVPVSEVEEMLPAIVMMAGEADVDERSPSGPLRLADKLKAGFVRKSVTLPCITRDA